MVQDITEKKRTQEDLELVSREMAAAVTRCSRDFRYLWANEGYADWLQRPLGEIVGHPIVDVLGKEAFETLLPHFKRVLAGQRVHYEQETNFRSVGKRWISAIYTPTIEADGSANGWVAVVLDITERKRAEQVVLEVNRALEAQAAVLESREELLKIFVSSVPAGVAMLDRDMRYLQVSDRWCADYSVNRSQAIGRSHYELFPDVPRAGKKCIAEYLREKHSEPTKIAGIAKTARHMGSLGDSPLENTWRDHRRSSDLR